MQLFFEEGGEVVKVQRTVGDDEIDRAVRTHPDAAAQPAIRRAGRKPRMNDAAGDQQRAGLCRAMMLRPELLLLDEPFSGLDAMTRKSIHEQFLKIHDHEPISSVLVTHDPQEAINLAEYMVVMRSGRVLQRGSVNEVLSNPADSYVEQLCAGLTGIAS